ncbi:pectate lyase family protein [Asticcacaulis tiandongensis]|uniref:pectate lyase family protein n=1 Tax=Asticcacaulis tiandongensis TaxID=2565365 RepID=UPI00112D793B|nr:pectate lyase [Asticcacaulis tiandongensis]
MTLNKGLRVLTALACLGLPFGATAQTTNPDKAPSDASGLNRATFGHKGWADTKGGAGGRILKVTNLNASGHGSFREAVEAEGPRIIVFEVGGVIDLEKSSISIKNPYLTIAGQTAPDPGITFIRGEFNLSTHDVIIQHIAVRPGQAGETERGSWSPDGISARGVHNIIIDHSSFSWAVDENLSASGQRFQGETGDEWRRGAAYKVTFSHNLIYEGLKESTHPKGEHSKGMLIHDNTDQIFVYGNVFASNYERNALFKGGSRAAMVNNLIYNPGLRAVHYNLVAHEWGGREFQTGWLTLVGNVYRQGPDTVPHTPLFTLGGVGDIELHLKNNIAVDTQGSPVAHTGRYTTSQARILYTQTPFLPEGVTPLAAERLEHVIPLTAGMRPWKRDPLDFKLLSDVVESRGLIVDHEGQSTGYPNYKPTQRSFNPDDWNLEDMSPKAGWDSLFVNSYKAR